MSIGDDGSSTIWMKWMSISQDEEIATFVSVNAALDAILFVGDELNEATIALQTG